MLFTVTRKYRNATYYIHVQNPDHVEKGISSMTINGDPVQGICVKPQENITEYHVEAIMG